MNQNNPRRGLVENIILKDMWGDGPEEKQRKKHDLNKRLVPIDFRSSNMARDI